MDRRPVDEDAGLADADRVARAEAEWHYRRCAAPARAAARGRPLPAGPRRGSSRSSPSCSSRPAGSRCCPRSGSRPTRRTRPTKGSCRSRGRARRERRRTSHRPCRTRTAAGPRDRARLAQEGPADHRGIAAVSLDEQIVIETVAVPPDHHLVQDRPLRCGQLEPGAREEWRCHAGTRLRVRGHRPAQRRQGSVRALKSGATCHARLTPFAPGAPHETTSYDPAAAGPAVTNIAATAIAAATHSFPCGAAL